MTIWFASGNAHKKKELEAILNGVLPAPVTVKIPSEADIPFDPEETGASFPENSLLKARALYRLLRERGLGGPVIADDSGLCVDALDGRPGIYSARYGGGEQPGAERNALLLKELGDNPNRKARFVCAMVLLKSDDEFYIAQETLEGELTREQQGKGGFGYDPIMRLPERGCTVAELPEDEKNAISHRGKAAKAIAKFVCT
ncbi:MAG: RdgB/HAM1 family non-canonical purine NTP pyrophosphatase [Treponema sp.]|nr:RdgB/HAM1 family non-canonical purine NTP pyrophosphatase [Treponema sp.]